jgi:predicted RNA-binding Zn-ribbon protein involved in translation (DUF1610 family)
MQSKSFTFGDANFTSTPFTFSQIDQSAQQISEFSGREAIAPCPNCGSVRVNLVRMLSASPHYADLRCAECDGFRCWEAKPANQQKWQWQQARIAILLKSPQLSQWEWKFLASVQSKRSLSPKQQKVLAQIDTKLGGQS